MLSFVICSIYKIAGLSHYAPAHLTYAHMCNGIADMNVLVVSGFNALLFLADHLWGGSCVMIGLRLVLIDGFERKKIGWVKRRITPEMVPAMCCVTFTQH